MVWHTIAVAVFQDFEPERRHHGHHWVSGVGPNGERGVVHGLGWCTTDDAGCCINDETIREVRGNFPCRTRHWVWRADRRCFRVVHQNSWTEWAGSNRVGVRTSNAHWWHRIGAITDAVIVGIRVKWVGAHIARAVVNAGSCLSRIKGAVSVVVKVFDQFALNWIVFGQFVRQTVTVSVFQNLQVEIKGNR